MEKEFVPYELALKMKQIGFDEPCFGYWKMSDWLIEEKTRTDGYTHADQLCSAPTFSQVFRWFREKYNLFGKIYIVNFGADEYSFDVYDLYEEKTKYDNFIGSGTSYSGTFDSYEEAELACITALINIVEGNGKEEVL